MPMGFICKLFRTVHNSFFPNSTWDIIRFLRVALILDDVFSVKVTGIGSLLFAETTSFLHADACC